MPKRCGLPHPNQPGKVLKGGLRADAREASLFHDPDALAEHVRGILERGIDGIPGDDRRKAPTAAAVREAIAETGADRDAALSAAMTARVRAQADGRAPNITALFRKVLAEDHG